MFKLVISDDEGKTTVVPLVRDEITIGRKEGNTIRLTERNVSRRHARLQRMNGTYTLEDLSSYNGVRINGQRIGDTTTLQAGDQVAIGDYLIALQNEEVAAVAPPTHPEKAPPARLVMLTPPAPGAEFALGRSGMRIGRAEDLDIWVNHRSISREHAELRTAGDVLTIHDLGSANGLRVNSEDVQEAELQPGDVIELGQVRFRYVGAGEKYVFEADATVQMDAVVLPEERSPSRAPLIAAVFIVLLAVAVGAGIALRGDPPPEDPVGRPIVEGPDPNVPPELPPEDVSHSEEVMALSDRCNSSLDAGDAAGAITSAEEALRLAPSSISASSCLERAQGVAREREAFDDALAELEGGDPVAAWLRLGEVSADSPLRDREEFARVRQAFIASRLDEAESAPDQAEELLAQAEAAADPREDRDLLARARRIRTAGSRVATVTMRGGSVNVRMGMAPDSNNNTNVVATAMEPDESARPSAMTIAVDICSFQPTCIVRETGTPRSAEDFRNLVEAYRRLRDTPNKERTIRQFVQRYPSNSYAQRYASDELH